VKAHRSHYGGQYVEGRWFLKTLSKRAGVKYFGFHASRRYVSSVLKRLGVPTPRIQDILGHASLRTTEIYIQNIDGDQATALNLMAGELEPNSTPTQYPKEKSGGD